MAKTTRKSLTEAASKELKTAFSLDKFKQFVNPSYAPTEPERYSIFASRMFNTESESDFFRDPAVGEPFYYPMNLNSIIEQYVEEITSYITIPEYVLNEISANRCKLLIYSSWEAPTRETIMHFVESLIKKYPTLEKKNVVVSTNNLELLYNDNIDTVYDNIKHSVHRINKIDDVTCIVHNMFMTIGIKNWQEVPYDSEEFEKQVIDSIELIQKNIKRKHKFVCLNRRPRPSRWMTALYLYPDKEDGLLSFTLDDGAAPAGSFNKFSETEIKKFKSIIDEKIKSKSRNDVNDSLSSFYEWVNSYLSKMPNYSDIKKKIMADRSGITARIYNDIRRTILDDIFINTYSRLYDSNFVNDLPLLINDNIDPRSNPVSDTSFDKFFNSYLHIVSETETGSAFDVPRSIEKYWFSEKIFKPIWFMQPFVLLGFPGALAHLKNLGFKTFSDFVDERYDSEPNSQRRLILALHSARQFYDRSHEEILADYNDMIDILRHNRNTLINYSDRLNEDLKTDVMNGLADCVWK